MVTTTTMVRDGKDGERKPPVHSDNPHTSNTSGTPRASNEKANKQPFHIASLIASVKTDLKEDRPAISVQELAQRLRGITIDRALSDLKESLENLETKPKKVDPAAVAARLRLLKTCISYSDETWALHIVDTFAPALNKDGSACELKEAPDGTEYLVFNGSKGFTGIPGAKELGLSEQQYTSFILLRPHARKLIQDTLLQNVETITKLKLELAVTNGRIVELTEESKQLKAELEQKTADIAALNTKVANVQKMRDNDQLELERYNVEKQRAVDAQYTLTQKLKDSENEISNLQKKAAELESGMAANAQAHEAALEELKARHSEELKEKDMAHREIDGLNEGKILELKAKVVELSKQITVLGEAKASLDAATAEVTKAQHEAAEERQKVSGIVEGYVAKLTESERAHATELETLNRTHGEELARLKESHTLELGIRTDELQKTITGLKGEVAALTNERETLLRKAEEDAQTIKSQQAQIVQKLTRRVEGSNENGIRDVTGKDPEYSEDIPETRR